MPDESVTVEDSRMTLTVRNTSRYRAATLIAYDRCGPTVVPVPVLRLHVCAAALDVTGADRAVAEARIGPVMSTPRFLRETAGARLVGL